MTQLILHFYSKHAWWIQRMQLLIIIPRFWQRVANFTLAFRVKALDRLCTLHTLTSQFHAKRGKNAQRLNAQSPTVGKDTVRRKETMGN
ncbi:hypothetical protein AN7207.2 [Aspergillus nidulans FGSC A4]|uniref:Uncharacterized protein n=1 Tax=Emericella nidulans (strain FGSC A4 / ATCC 38163 / CBS 112.46 / NRRL 194 / M139) TaxID=227321 RepID=Q5AWX3_EMENI|nr:hypothetical protein [Aspergillus nidulans FGSC A4]EAA61459.1 hypothetical protein AN7207.2 [Aspergillus nidulans FGSC A4]CBF78866.1 TPA: hypothetical protein ANIA_07207 [Aspergillus nidulans FGSC A4]|eukprot:XP_664811.1 hypothetical protein AN7207.2 [Aspergillus nidulans FGSC A4]